MGGTGKTRVGLIASIACVGVALLVTGVTVWRSGTGGSRFITAWGNKGERPGSFLYIEDLHVDRSGSVYVVDRNTALITVFDANGQLLRSLGGRPWLEAPEGVAVDSEGNLLVGDFRLHTLFKFAPDGKLLWKTRGPDSHPMRHIEFIDVDDHDNVYVADSGNHRIQVFDKNGTALRRFGHMGIKPGEFHNPEGVCADSRTNSLYVTDYDNKRVQKFDLQGNFVAEWQGPHGLAGPIGIALHPENGRIYVGESKTGRIQVFEPNGDFVEMFGREGSGPGEFRNLHGIAIDGQGRLFVGDTGNSRIQVIQSTPGQPRPSSDTAK